LHTLFGAYDGHPVIYALTIRLRKQGGIIAWAEGHRGEY